VRHTATDAWRSTARTLWQGPASGARVRATRRDPVSGSSARARADSLVQAYALSCTSRRRGDVQLTFCVDWLMVHAGILLSLQLSSLRATSTHECAHIMHYPPTSFRCVRRSSSLLAQRSWLPPLVLSYTRACKCPAWLRDADVRAHDAIRSNIVHFPIVRPGCLVICPSNSPPRRAGVRCALLQFAAFVL